MENQMSMFLSGRSAALVAASVLLPLVAHAATPESGTLTLESGAIEFSSGPNVGVNPTPQAEAVCMDVVLPCDHFALTIDLPENIGEYFPSALIRIKFSWDDPTGAAVEDYDIYMYDAAGNEANSAATGNNPEVMTQLAIGGVQEFNFDVVFFSVVGSTYTGHVELDLGEPSEEFTEEELEDFFTQNSVVARVLGTDNGSDQPANASVQRRSSGGALGGGVLILGMLGAALTRRRRQV
jgi:hypothetical protein